MVTSIILLEKILSTCEKWIVPAVIKVDYGVERYEKILVTWGYQHLDCEAEMSFTKRFPQDFPSSLELSVLAQQSACVKKENTWAALFGEVLLFKKLPFGKFFLSLETEDWISMDKHRALKSAEPHSPLRYCWTADLRVC